MPRRRKKNPLLMRILMISMAAHAVALPIAAHYGAFDKLKRQFGEARVTLIPLPKEEKERPQTKDKKAKPKVTKTKASSRSVKNAGPAKPNPNLRKVVATNSTNDNGEGPSIEQGTKTNAGEVPTEKTNPAPTKDTAPTTQPKTDAGAKPITPPPPPPPPPVATPTVTKPAHVPVFAEAEQEYSPQPAIPDDLRVDSLDKDCVLMLTVGPDGNPTDIKIAQSTGISELDDVAVSTTKKWRFKPASLDGQGVESKVKLTIQFRVE